MYKVRYQKKTSFGSYSFVDDSKVYKSLHWVLQRAKFLSRLTQRSVFLVDLDCNDLSEIYFV